ncbi:MAG TPA: transglycosylase SLT domain-containing protein [Pyrinomonadaceae bacterium]|jgi:hypothetical protein|nr:transglycosylase SLT domain-containing protein [Pyrinomonadaceae bacterium]
MNDERPTTDTAATNPLIIPIAAALCVVIILALAAFILSRAAKRTGAGEFDEASIAEDERRAEDGPTNEQDANDEPTTSDNQAATTNDNQQDATASVEASPVASSSDASAPYVEDFSGSDALAPPAAANVKLYLNMSQPERLRFVEEQSQRISRIISNRATSTTTFTPAAIAKIKVYVDAYAARARIPPSEGCNMRQGLSTLLKRASHYAPYVSRSFNEKGLAPVVGLYLAMIESEYCTCLSSGTGAKGMFQFVGTTARRYGVPDVSRPSTDRRPDDRCKVEIMAPIAAEYMKNLVTMFGTGPLSVPLAVASYNEGEGGLSQNLARALDAARNSANPERSFWTMVANSDILSEQFQNENIRYVPKFFAAAIVGENPQTFGVQMQPLSSY